MVLTGAQRRGYKTSKEQDLLELGLDATLEVSDTESERAASKCDILSSLVYVYLVVYSVNH